MDVHPAIIEGHPEVYDPFGYGVFNFETNEAGKIAHEKIVHFQRVCGNDGQKFPAAIVRGKGLGSVSDTNIELCRERAHPRCNALGITATR